MPGFFFFHYGIHQSCVKLLKMFLRIFFPTKLFAISCNFASPQIHFSIRFDKIAALFFLHQKYKNGKIKLFILVWNEQMVT